MARNAATQSKPRRGRPLKFGRPATLVAVALPNDVLAKLRQHGPDIGRAIVAAVERDDGNHGQEQPATAPLVELTRVVAGRSLIFVNPARLPPIPGVLTVPVAKDRALLALEEPGGLADLEVAVRDALEQHPAAGAEELRAFAEQVRQWRHDSRLKVQARQILVVSRSARPSGAD